ncbi:MAG TPA: efflux RND transporter periplasmic adaptor subunit [Nitrospirota bacterium]|nr:efflux RND transporter periplasmic adaptor subunit [Nitrospirota bacterium]
MRFKGSNLLGLGAVILLAFLTGVYFAKSSDMPLKSGFGSGQENVAEGQTPSDLSSSRESDEPLASQSLTLGETQLKSIKVAPVGKHPFAVEREAVGSIDFDEDLSVVQAESALIGAAATFEVTSKELARAKALYATNVGVSQKELDQAISDKQTAEGAFKAAHDAVRVLGKTETEIDHMIASGKIEPALVSRVAVAYVSESDTPLLHVGQPVTVKVMAYPDRVFEGKVTKIYAVVEPDTHRTKIRAKIADRKNELRPGMLISVMIRIQEPVEANAIPVTGVVREGDGTMTVWFTTDRHRFIRKPVKLGLQKDGWYQIVEGLQPGELVVTEGGIFLSNMLEAPPTD